MSNLLAKIGSIPSIGTPCPVGAYESIHIYPVFRHCPRTIDKNTLCLYNESKIGGGEMPAGLSRYMMQLRMESKAKEDQNKPPITSPDVVQTTALLFSKKSSHVGDSGKLLLAKRKTDRNDRYLVKHEFADCACNKFVYTNSRRTGAAVSSCSRSVPAFVFVSPTLCAAFMISTAIDAAIDCRQVFLHTPLLFFLL